MPFLRAANLARGFRFLAVVLGLLVLNRVPGASAQQRADSQAPLVRSLEAPLPLPVLTFGSADYNSAGQNWSVAEVDGRIYVANNSGVLTYDGANWLPAVPMDNGGIARTLVKTDDGRLLLGGASELGVVEPRGGLPLRYRSLTSHLPDSLQGFGDVWRGVASGNDAVFVLSQQLMLFHGAADSVSFWTKPHVSTRAVQARDTVFIVSPEDELPVMAFLDGEVRAVDSDLGRRIQQAHGLFSVRIGEIDYVLGRRALLAVSPTDVRLLEDFPAAEVADGWPYGMAAAPGGALIVSTIEAGAVVVDLSGRVVRRITRASGLPENVAQCAFVDSAGALWLCHDIGVSRVQLSAPLRTFRGAGVPSSVNDAALSGDTVYAVNVPSLTSFTLAQDGIDVHRSADLVDGRELLVTPFGTLAGHSEGVVVVRGKRLTRIGLPAGHNPYTQTLVPLTDDLTRVVSGHVGGPCLLRYDAGQWTRGNCLLGLDMPSVTRGARGPEGDVWLGSDYQGVLQLRYDARTDSLRLVRHHTDTLLTSRSLVPIRIADSLYLESEPLLVWRQGAFVPERGALSALFDSMGPYVLRETSSHRIAVIGTQLGLVTPGASPSIDSLTHDQLLSRDLLEVLAMPDGRLLALGLLAMSLVDPSAVDDLALPAAPRLSHLRHSGPDTLIAAGGALRPEQRDLTLVYATLPVDLSGPTLYRTRLVGYEEAWSAWSEATERVFTNLAPRAYTFEMQARDAWGRTSDVGSERVRVLPRWYGTWWALLFFLLGATLLLMAVVSQIVRRRGRQLAERNAELEAQVAARTSDLEEQAREQARLNERLSVSNAKLEEASHQKTALLGIAVHDLRNPIANVKSLAELLRMDLPSDMEDPRELVDMIHESSGIMLRLIEDLLRSNEAERGALRMDISPLDFSAVGRAAVETMRAQASAKEQRLVWEETDVWVLADAERARDVIFNLVSNAIKYSPRGSTIRTRLSAADGFGCLEVRDQGPGLSKEDRAGLFQPFQKLSARPTEGESSTGLGLYIVRQYVEQMGGRVGAESAPGEGSTFWFELPLAPEPDAVGATSVDRSHA